MSVNLHMRNISVSELENSLETQHILSGGFSPWTQQSSFLNKNDPNPCCLEPSSWMLRYLLMIRDPGLIFNLELAKVTSKG